MKQPALSLFPSLLLLASNTFTLANLEARTLEKRSSPRPTDPTFIDNVLSSVNSIRGKHAAPALVWDATLASFALKKSNGCKLDHTGPHGENAFNFWYIPATTTPDFAAQVKSAFDYWIRPEESDAYKAGNLADAYHFTQTVWKASKKIGCAFSTERCTQNPNQEWWFYCEFSPMGNIVPYYPGNVTV